MSDNSGYFWSAGGEETAAPEVVRGGLDFQARLNPAQYEAVSTINGPVLVVAGAGSGKTRTLVHRVAYLVEQGTPPESILLLTFTRKAASQMLIRAEEIVGHKCARVSGGTFHSLAHELLRKFASRLDYPVSFGVMDRGDMEEVLSQLRKDFGLAKKDKSFPKRGTLATLISKAANKDMGIESLLEKEYPHLLKFVGDINRLAVEYADYKKKSALMDFDDLLIKFAGLLGNDHEARELISSFYNFIMVDEYQDTNPVQAEIVHLLGRDHNNVMVVGDDAQSIYSFRGASFRNIMEFPKRFPGAKVVRLEENYRSSQPILNLTNHIISKARERYEKKLFTRRSGGVRPGLITFDATKEQSLFVCRKVQELVENGLRPDQIAVLFRASFHSFDLEVELVRLNIDFVKHGGRRFLDAAHIKDLLAFLRVTANPSDAVSLGRVLMLLDGIGPKGASDIAAWAGGKRENLASLENYPGRPKVVGTLGPLASIFKSIMAKRAELQSRVDKVWEFYEPYMVTRFDDYPKRMGDVQEFLRLSREYSSMTRFLADMTLEPPNASGPRGDGELSGSKLTLSTIHSAKGLEWKAVFILSAVEGKFPPPYVLNNPEELEEERRLMYVAATRAEDELYLLCPLDNDDWRNPMSYPRPSRFLEDIPSDYFSSGREKETAASVIPPPGPPDRTMFNPNPDSDDSFSRGDRVAHRVFGLGRVTGLPGNNRIVVDFDHFGQKKLDISFAGLKKA